MNEITNKTNAWKDVKVEYTKFNTEDDKKVMNLNCKMLKSSHFPHYLRIRECRNRYIKGYGEHYMEIADKVQNSLIRLMLDSHGGLTAKYKARTKIHTDVGSQTPEGMTNVHGNMWVPYFRVFVPLEEWAVLAPLGKLKGLWNNRTLAMGKSEGGTPDQVSQQIIAARMNGLNDGYAEELIDEVNSIYDSTLPYSIKLKLSSSYASRNNE